MKNMAAPETHEIEPWHCTCIMKFTTIYNIISTVLHSRLSSTSSVVFWLQAYTSQFLALTMFALMMSEDRISMQQRRKEIVEGMKQLPGEFMVWNCKIKHFGLCCLKKTTLYVLQKLQ